MHIVIARHGYEKTLRRIYERRLAQLDVAMLDLLRNARVHEETVTNMQNFVATSLQRFYRGWKGRVVASIARHRHLSAIQIQRIVRGRQGRRKALRERRRQNMVLQSPWAMRQLISRSIPIRTIGPWQELLDPWTNEFYYFEVNTQDSQWQPPPEYVEFLKCDWRDCSFVAHTTNEIHDHKRTLHTCMPRKKCRLHISHLSDLYRDDDDAKYCSVKGLAARCP
ncbi:hypothetical protein Ae201684P_006339 [Aphanomyces euteiches]|nr:hypothetical protein Ae201684P_006339 [Aphanomyces euteiches]